MEIEKPSDGIGERVAFYRKLNGFSAADLSTRTHGSISKGVIANIETGRKRDLTVDELITISWALGVPPLAIALPIESPDTQIKVADGGDTLHTINVSNVARWFVAPAMPIGADFRSSMQGENTPSGALATSRINTLFRWWSDFLERSRMQRRIKLAKELGEDTESFEERLAEAEKSLELDRQQMSTFGMNSRHDG